MFKVGLLVMDWCLQLSAESAEQCGKFYMRSFASSTPHACVYLCLAVPQHLQSRLLSDCVVLDCVGDGSGF